MVLTRNQAMKKDLKKKSSFGNVTPVKTNSRSSLKRTPSKSTPRRRKKVEKKKAPPPEEEDIYREPVKKFVKPESQLDLTEVQLKEEVTRVLTGDDPNVPKNISTFNYKERCYKLDPPGLSDNMAIHFIDNGCSLHIESKEYQAHRALYGGSKEEDGKVVNEQSSVSTGTGTSTGTGAGEGSKNRFNFSERSTQTLNNKQRSIFVCTEPPPVAQYSANVSQWQIYDSYIQEYTNLQMGYADAEYEKPVVKKPIKEDADDDNTEDNEEEVIRYGTEGKIMMKSLKIVERLVNQNSQDEIYQDFKYWEDASDEYRQGEGSLLPLWRFSYERTKKKQVTSLCWNPHNPDLFAVGYGSYNFLQQGGGFLCCFSLKNTSYPEYIFSLDSGVLSLNFHPQFPSLLAVGCYDGNVAVYDVAKISNKPIYQSSVLTGKHNDPVWQVHWQKHEVGKEVNFYSISSDGTVLNWSLNKNELKMEPVIQLKLEPSIHKNGTEESTIVGLASGCCFDFNKKHDHLFLVGTEEGNIYKCSKAYSGQYLQTFTGHHMAVYAVRWNTFHEEIFISCSADWTVKLWDHEIGYPLLSLDLGNSVGDVMWSPFSSTTFSAVTSDGKAHVYDLYENKQDPLCIQKVVKRAKLTRGQFNNKDHILIVGDDRGGVNSLKLSPNLRNLHLPDTSDSEQGGDDHDDDDEEGGKQVVDVEQIQRDKIDKLRTVLDAKPRK